jgi:hypothetical protein
MLNKKLILLLLLINPNGSSFYGEDQGNTTIIVQRPEYQTHIEKRIFVESKEIPTNNESSSNHLNIGLGLVGLLIIVGFIVKGKDTSEKKIDVKKVLEGNERDILVYKKKDGGLDHTMLDKTYKEIPYYELITKELTQENFADIIKGIMSNIDNFTTKTLNPANNILLTFDDKNFSSLINDINIQNLIVQLNSQSTGLSVSFKFNGSNYKQSDFEEYIRPIVENLTKNSKHMLMICKDNHIKNMLINTMINSSRQNLPVVIK